ncbi:dihydrofolate reductase [Nematocida ausubeli]|nr:dihydrofolate reductase [Nematocida ausubeli]
MLPVVLAAYSEGNGVIGREGRLPWPSIKVDFQFMKYLTTKSPSGLIMGRLTYESIGKPLPKRTSIVITSQDKENIQDPNYSVLFCKSLESAISICRNLSLQPIIFGGAAVYKEALKKYKCKLYLTEIYKRFEGDAFFPLDLIDKRSLLDITPDVLKELSIPENLHRNKVKNASEESEIYLTQDGRQIPLINTLYENGINYSFLTGYSTPLC